MADTLRISLAAARVNAGMTQDDVARELHISKATLGSWEKGKSEPTITQGQKLSSLFNIPMDRIIFLPSKSN